jgi:hypothetical protein
MTAALVILRRVPPWVWVLIGVLAWGGWQRHQARSIERKHTQAVAAAAAERETKLQADAAETARRLAAQKGITDDARKQAQTLAADALRARTAEQQLRARLAAYTANAGASHPAAASGSPPTAQDAGMLADLFGRCLGSLRVMAATADDSRAAGEACQRSYDALSAEK